jgi:hypothetical protein
MSALRAQAWLAANELQFGRPAATNNQEVAMEHENSTPIPEARHRSPSLGAVSIVYTLLFLGSLAVMFLLAGSFREHGTALRLVAFLQFGAAVPLGVYAATAASRLQFLGVNVAGVVIALFGGVAASVFAAISALFEWALAQPGIATDGAATRILHIMTFTTGGVGFVATFGLLVAGVSVICLFTKFLPRWLVWLGLVVAALAELSSFSLIFPQVAFLLPMSRFPGLIWLIGAGLKLPRSRAEAQRQRRAVLS